MRLFFTFLMCCSLTLGAQTFPDRVWHAANEKEAQPWQNDKARAFREYLIDSTKITGLMIVHKGKVVFDFGDLQE